MTTNFAPLPESDPSTGVSEMIGAILMITVVVAAVAIIAIFLFSQPAPEKIPNVNFMTGTNADGTQLYLYHNGGDALTRGEFAVVIDNQPPRTDYSISDGSAEWAVGKNLVLGITVPPQRVSLVYYEGNGGTILLRSASSSVAALKKNISPSGTPVPQGGTGGQGYIYNDAYNISNSSYFIEAIQENITANRIDFYKDSKGTLSAGSVLSLRVKDTQQKSLIIYTKGGTNNLVKLNNSDIITVRIITQTKNFKAFGIAPQIWELAVDQADLTITRSPPVPTITVTGASITHTWLDKYELVSSTISPYATGSSVTALTVNETRYLPLPPQSTDSNDITITNARPLPVGLFVLITDESQHAAYLVGTADQICVGTNCGPYGL